MSDPTAPPPGPPPSYQGGPPVGGPSEPPPKYEPPKGQPGYGTGYPSQGGYPPSAGYPPQGYQAGPTTVVHTQPQPVTVIQMTYGPNPVTINCPHCHNHVTTSLVHETGALTWIAAGILCLFGCWLGCCLIPFCVPELQDVEHRCPVCFRFLGRFRRLS